MSNVVPIRPWINQAPWPKQTGPQFGHNPERIFASEEDLATTVLELLRERAETEGTLEVTAYEVASAIDPEGRCSLEAVSEARRILENLAGNTVLDISYELEIGGDIHPVFGLGPLFPEAS